MISKQHDGHIGAQRPLKTYIKKSGKSERDNEEVGKGLQKKAELRHMNLKSDEPVD